MNFFQQQEKARKQSKWLIAAFVGVTLLIVLVIDAIVLLAIGTQIPLSTSVSSMEPQQALSLFSVESISANAGLLAMVSLGTASVIGLSSLVKIASLRSGGAKVAASLGGTLVTADTRDPLRRRLYNVVEEISIASGTPVPDVFVLESEPGINAFAAGYSAADAAVAVTQGTLERLNRAELQGVIAHEFSHIFNGDMRINIRLMGIIFGIMVIAIVGRRFLHSTRYARSSSRNNNAGAVLVIGGALMIVGYVGLFFARWMKAALSRQREYLADASAVQYTRDPEGISGALKKIAAYSHASYLHVDSEEVSHMLFGSGFKSLMFATHPPLEQRIQRIEKSFNAGEIEQLAKKLKAQERREHAQADKAAKELDTPKVSKKRDFIFDVDDIVSNIGSPSTGRIVAAALLTEEIGDGLRHAAHSTEWSPEVLMYCLLDSDQTLREQQLLIVTQEMGDLSEGKIRHLLTTNGLIKVDHRLPLMEIAYPSLKRRPVSDVEKLLSTIEKMSKVDNKIDSFEYLLSRLIQQYMRESHIPNRTRIHGNKKVKNCIDELAMVVSILASHGQNSKSAQGLQFAQKAFKAGMASAGIQHKNLSFDDDWQQKLDHALGELDELSATEKATVVKALATTVLDDKQFITEEQEMMRVICALIHVPLPMLQTAV